MKKLFVIFITSCFLLCFANSAHAQFNKLKNKIKDKVNQRIDNKEDKTIDKTLDDAENTTKNNNNNDDNKNKNNNTKNPQDTTTSDNTTATPTLKVYSNYDFVPGDKIMFEDHFTDDQDGEFATHWELKAGQAVLNKLNGELVMDLIDGNYVRVNPRMKTPKYLTDPYTIEFDWYHVPGAYGVILQLGYYDKESESERTSEISIQEGEINFNGNISLGKTYSAEIKNGFNNKWHHVAIAFKNHQLKTYLDQYRILVVPDTKEDYENVTFAGIGSEENPIIFKNVRIASGGNMNMIGKKFTEAKIVTHGINFDIDKATIKPESMGTLNMIVQVMKDNPDIKFEVDGHTDNTGTAAHNLTLSQQRADAVKEQLTKLGIDASRLTSKGFGDTKPISDNNILEGKANNRRVEFVKM